MQYDNCSSTLLRYCNNIEILPSPTTHTNKRVQWNKAKWKSKNKSQKNRVDSPYKLSLVLLMLIL